MLAPMAAFAQKFGHCDTQAILQSLPEISKVNGELEALGKQYAANNIQACAMGVAGHKSAYGYRWTIEKL